MSGKELIESLRKTGDKKILILRQEAEAEAGKLRAEVAARIERMRADNARVRSARVNAVLSAGVSEANNRARHAKLLADKALAERLFAVAGSSLRQLRNEGYLRAFEKLARELPSLRWQVVRVNPLDVDFAKRYFPAAEVLPDEHISGGMDASAEKGAVRVINTFEKRLERAWPDLLPRLIEDAYREARNGLPAES
ncbi:MAG TPA: V-type ATP synthase subunit E [Nitrospirota bacterium]